MQIYLDLIKTILENGNWKKNRTGTKTISMPGLMMRYDLTNGFPAITTRKLAFKSAIGELIGFLRGVQNAADFRKLDCNIWDRNANENSEWLNNPYRIGIDDLGNIYGKQWRNWHAYKHIHCNDVSKIDNALKKGFQIIAKITDHFILYKTIDQLMQCIEIIHKYPNNRRILFHAWNPAELDEMALPPCHLLYQFFPNPEQHELSLCLYVRSNDIALGAPFNICEAAILLHLVGKLTGYKPKWLTYFIGDAHIYENQIEMLRIQITRQPFSLPQLLISDRIPDYNITCKYTPEWIDKIEPYDFSLKNYIYHPPINIPMTV